MLGSVKQVALSLHVTIVMNVNPWVTLYVCLLHVQT